jgi:hypothetical protein
MQVSEKRDDLKQKTGFFESESPQNGPKTGENQPFFRQTSSSMQIVSYSFIGCSVQLSAYNRSYSQGEGGGVNAQFKPI